MTSPRSESINLERVVITGIIESIHRIVAGALEENFCRTHIGCFEVEGASGKFQIEDYRNSRRVLVDTLTQYELHLELESDEVPGAGKNPGSVSVVYSKDVTRNRTNCLFHVLVCYHLEQGGLGGWPPIDEWGYDMTKRKIAFDRPQMGNITPKTIRWIYDQLRTDTKVPQ